MQDDFMQQVKSMQFLCCCLMFIYERIRCIDSMNILSFLKIYFDNLKLFDFIHFSMLQHTGLL